MATSKRGIQNKLYYIFALLTLSFIAVLVRLVNIQFVDGAKYKNLSKQLTLRTDTIQANRGNVFSSDGSLLATSMSQYEIRMDTYTVNADLFKKNVKALSASLSKMLGKSPQHWEQKIRKARKEKNRYLFIARKLDYSQYIKIKTFPIFNKGMFKGGFIAEQSTVRAHPLGKVAERTIGYDDYRGAPGIEGAYRNYLRGKYGWRKKQKIAKGQWKPINDNNELEPIDGKDVITTIDINIQDIAHHSLLRQLEHYNAEHGCVVVMETKTGYIKAISNLGKAPNGNYYERRNYAIYESNEPGSAFKVMSMVALLEEKVIDSNTVVDTGKGRYRIYRRFINDSHRGGFGKISAARALEVSSNIAFAKMVDENFSKNPQKFINRLNKMHLNQKLGLPIKGEGNPIVPGVKNKLWSKNALPSISYGYNLKLTPLQILTFYNAIANNGKMVKPLFVKEIKNRNKQLSSFNTEVINEQVCSPETTSKVKEILKNVIIKGTGKKLYDKNFSMAGKTGTARVDYGDYEKWSKDKKYISSFTGFFPAENPKYSCIVVIHKPDLSKGYYGADVSGPVFKDIAQKIYTSNYSETKVSNENIALKALTNKYNKYYALSNNSKKIIPKVIGMPLMDALPLLENLGLKVIFSGKGKVKEQSVIGKKAKKGMEIVLKLG